MTDLSNGPNGADPAPTSAPGYHENKGPRTIILLLGALAALGGAYLLFFLSMLMIGFSFDAPGSHFTDSGVWLRLLMLWPPVSLLLVAIAAVVCIFGRSLRLLWIALGLFVGTIVAIFVAMSLFA